MAEPEVRGTPSTFRRFPAIIAAILLYAILVILVVEVCATGSSLQWLIVVIALLYAGFSHLFWQKTSYVIKAGLSTLVLLLMMALLAWSSDLTAGGRMTIMWIPAPTVAAVVALTALVAAAILIAMFPGFPHAGRFAVGGLCLYAALPLVVALLGSGDSAPIDRAASFLPWLPFWLRGLPLATLVLLPAGFLAAVYRLVFLNRDPSSSRIREWGFVATALLLCFFLMLPQMLNPHPQGLTSAIATVGGRGPGLHRQIAASLRLAGPPNFDLTGVTPESFATALGRDPRRMFEFVRDQIAFEAYVGVLRGPRGTLLAMGGNSPDRASLLASLLERAGQHVRYAHGTLSERDAQTLVYSMFVDRPDAPLPAGNTRSTPPLQAIIKGFLPALKRDFDIVGSQLKRSGQSATADPTGSAEALTKEARDHYWVQWLNGGRWIDLDPSFAGAVPGQTFAQTRETLDTLPEGIHHRVTIRLQVEENSDAGLSTRTILTYAAAAADLSGVDVVLSHFPENWKGPVSSLEEAIGSAVADTGRIKPVLLIQDNVVTGEPFRQRVVTGGLGGIPSMLSGEGTRHAATLATAETLEVEFTGPDGTRTTVQREIYDSVGKAQRRAGKTLTAKEVQSRAETLPDLTQGVYSLFFTTGRIDAGYLSDTVTSTGGTEQGPADLLLALRRFSILFAALSDTANRLGHSGQVAVSYQDSPRLSIIDLRSQSGTYRLTFDLRRDYARTIAIGLGPQHIALARAFRGVLDGTLERYIMDCITTDMRVSDKRWETGVSTSLLFGRAGESRIPTIVLSRGRGHLDAGVPDDARARILEDVSNGYLVIAPQRPIAIDGIPRLAWWRVAPQSGESIAVTDEGLHAVAVEYEMQRSNRGLQVRMAAREVVDGVRGPMLPRTGWMTQGSPEWWRVWNDFHNVMKGAIYLGSHSL